MVIQGQLPAAIPWGSLGQPGTWRQKKDIAGGIPNPSLPPASTCVLFGALKLPSLLPAQALSTSPGVLKPGSGLVVRPNKRVYFCSLQGLKPALWELDWDSSLWGLPLVT